MGSTHRVQLFVNGERRSGETAGRTSLADFLRDELGLTGTHLGCEHGVCGACTVLLDRAPVRSCIMLAAQADGHDVRTIEGVSAPGAPLSPVQQAFCDTHALQCGFCTPGMVLAAEALLAERPRPDDAEIDEALGGNICRCTGYVQIREAVRLAADRTAGDRGMVRG
jgi:aerobic-type carbon monoxide dehydrogenase small subunit (CoxS/CutS family)